MPDRKNPGLNSLPISVLFELISFLDKNAIQNLKATNNKFKVLSDDFIESHIRKDDISGINKYNLNSNNKKYLKLAQQYQAKKILNAWYQKIPRKYNSGLNSLIQYHQPIDTIVNLLNEANKKLNSALNEREKTHPIHLAIQSRYSDMLNKILKEFPEELEAEDCVKETPLFHAIAAGDREIIEKLLKSGANILHKDIRGGTVLHHAIEKKQFDIAKLLPKYESKIIHEANKYGETPLFYAVAAGDKATVKMLIKRNADILHKNIDNETVLHHAIKQKRSSVAKSLIAHNPKIIHEKNNKGETPLKTAILNKQAKIATTLLQEYKKQNRFTDALTTIIEHHQSKTYVNNILDYAIKNELTNITTNASETDYLKSFESNTLLASDKIIHAKLLLIQYIQKKEKNPPKTKKLAFWKNNKKNLEAAKQLSKVVSGKENLDSLNFHIQTIKKSTTLLKIYQNIIKAQPETTHKSGCKH